MATPRNSFARIGENIDHTVKRASMYIAGKGASEAVGIGLVGEGEHAFVQSLTGIISGGGASLGVVVALGSITALSTGLTQMDYRHKRSLIKETYKEEIAAKLRKPTGQVSDQDLESVARGDSARGIEANSTIGEALSQARKQRNFGIVMSVASSLTSFTLVTLAAASIASGVGALGFAGGSLAAGAVTLLAKGVVGLAIYNAVKTPLHWAGDKLFGLEKEATHEMITDLKHAREAKKQISREQVFDVFIQAHPELDGYIASQEGKPFEKLSIAAKEKVMDQVGKLINLEQLTSAINQDKVNAGELAFAVNGQISGVYHETPVIRVKEKTLLGVAWDKCCALIERVKPSSMQETPITVTMPSGNTRPDTASNKTLRIDYAEQTLSGPKSGHSFVKQLNRPKFDPSLSQVERLSTAGGDSIRLP